MPLDHPPLLDEELNAIRLWIESFPVEMWGAPATPPVAERRIEPARRGEQGMHSTHLGQLPTAESAGRGNLEFRFLHRFRPAVDTAGSRNLFGLDGGADISLGLAYGLSERVDLGLRRTNVDRQLETWGKFRWLEQQAGGSPLSLALFASGARDDEESSAQRSHLAGGIVLQRRFGERFTALLAPLCASRTQIEDRDDRRGTCALGVGGSWRLNDILALTGEWIAQLSGPTRRYEGGTIGLSIATSRHTFHLLLTNTPDAHTSQYLTGGDLDWGEGDFRLGFNITRSFGLRTGRY
jgi:hypothetical protein